MLLLPLHLASILVKALTEHALLQPELEVETKVRDDNRERFECKRQATLRLLRGSKLFGCHF